MSSNKTELIETWAVVELFGHQVIAGKVSKVEPFGGPMLRVEVPETSVKPAFTKDYGPTAIYGISYVSEEVARATAEAVAAKPVAVFVPEIDDLERALKENRQLKKVIRDLTTGLPAPAQRHFEERLSRADIDDDDDDR